MKNLYEQLTEKQQEKLNSSIYTALKTRTIKILKKESNPYNLTVSDAITTYDLIVDNNDGFNVVKFYNLFSN